MLYRLFRALARLTLHLFFRHIEVGGSENVPDGGPVLLVPNHTNALVDPLVILIVLRRRVTITAKNVLARNPLLGLLIKGLGVVTFHRRDDVGKGADLRENVRSLQACRAVLAGGGALCIFPEGVSHSDPKLRRFHTGAARIALDYVRKDGDPGRLRVVPVGLLYTEKDQFRSGVWLRFGVPIDVRQWLTDHPDATAATLTEEVRQRVEALTLNYETRKESVLLSWAADVVATRGVMPAPLHRDRSSVAERFQLVEKLQAGYRTLLARRPAEVEELSARVRRYRSELRRLGIDPGEVYLPLHPGRALFFLVRELELLIVGSPLALFGALNHIVPYLLVKRVARALSKDKDHWASNVVYPSFLVFPCFYLAQLAAAWLLLPAVWAGVYTMALPYTGYYALLYRDRIGAAFRRARAFFLFLFDRSMQEQLAQEGRALIGHIRQLGEELGTLPAGSAAAFPPSAAPHGPADLETQLRADVLTLREVHATFGRLAAATEEAPSTIRVRQRGYFTPDEDDRVRQLLLTYRNVRLTLYEIIERCQAREPAAGPADRLRCLLVGYAAALLLCTHSLRLIRLYEDDPPVRQKLNEPDGKFGLEAGFFDWVLAAFTSLHNYRLLGQTGRYWRRQRHAVKRYGLADDPEFGWLAGVIRQQRPLAVRGFWGALWHRLRRDRRAFRQLVIRPLGDVRYGLQSWFGSTFSRLRLTPHYRPALDEAVLDHLRPLLQPGDVLLVRAERKATSALLPGFWAHAALYFGDRRDLERLGISGHEYVRKHGDRLPDGDRHGWVIEAVSPGVVLSPLAHSLHADHVLVLRPNVSEEDRRTALAEAFGHVGKPYDFEFDFNVTSRLVCTELIYRSYHGRGPVEFALVKRLGRFTLSCDDMLNQFLEAADRGGRPQSFEVVTLVLQSSDGRAYFHPTAGVLETLRAIQGGMRPSASWAPPDTAAVPDSPRD
jgi:1-acyl-sn-glycerol-3-phosphate acyltransferase